MNIANSRVGVQHDEKSCKSHMWYLSFATEVLMVMVDTPKELGVRGFGSFQG